MLKAQLSPRSDYSGGLNSNENPLAVKDNEASDCVNIRPGLFRSIQKITGFTKLNTSGVGSNINATFDFADTDATHILMSVRDANLFKMDSFNGTWNQITDTAALNDDRCEIRQFYASEPLAIISCYTAVNIQSWDGTSASTSVLTTNLAAKHIWADENTGRLWATGRVANEPIAYFTPIATSSFNLVNDTIQVTTDGSDLVAFRSLKGILYAWSTTGVYRINDLGGGTGAARFGAKRVTDSRGTRSPQSLQNVNLLGLGEGIIYLDASLQLQFFDGFNTVPISLKFNFRASFSSAHSLDRISQSNLEDVHAIYYKPWDMYLLFYQEDSDNNHNNVIGYHTILKSGWPMEGITAKSSAVAFDSGTEKMFIGGTTGLTWQWDSGANFDGKTIPSHFQFSRKTPTPGARVKFRQTNFTVKPTVTEATLTVKARVDFKSSFETLHIIKLDPSGADLLGSSFVLGTSTLGGSVEGALAAIRIDRIGKLLQLRLEENSDKVAWQVYGDELAITPIGVH